MIVDDPYSTLNFAGARGEQALLINVLPNSKLVVQMCGMFVLEDSKSIVDMLVSQGKDRAVMEEQLSWYFHSPSFSLHSWAESKSY